MTIGNPNTTNIKSVTAILHTFRMLLTVGIVNDTLFLLSNYGKTGIYGPDSMMGMLEQFLEIQQPL